MKHEGKRESLSMRRFSIFAWFTVSSTVSTLLSIDQFSSGILLHLFCHACVSHSAKRLELLLVKRQKLKTFQQISFKLGKRNQALIGGEGAVKNFYRRSLPKTTRSVSSLFPLKALIWRGKNVFHSSWKNSAASLKQIRSDTVPTPSRGGFLTISTEGTGWPAEVIFIQFFEGFQQRPWNKFVAIVIPKQAGAVFPYFTEISDWLGRGNIVRVFGNFFDILDSNLYL